MPSIVDFACWVAVVALVSAFLLSLAVKWGWLEWMQVHAPNGVLERLLGCKFCVSFWTGAALSLALAAVTGEWLLLAVPVCSTLLTRELW